jgi:uncharacterized protein (DUF2062 family)
MEVESVPIHRYYHCREKTVSHFRPIIDLIRIGKVNSKAALIKILLPWKTIRSPGKTWQEKLLYVFKRELYGHSPSKSAFSLAMGVCVGIMPIYGFQIALLMALTPILRLNWPLAFLGSCISSPPAIPFLVAAAVALGTYILPFLPFVVHRTVIKGGMEWIVGSIALALCAGFLTYAVMYPVLARINRRKKNLL